MKISFDNLRKHIAADFNNVVRELNNVEDIVSSCGYLREYLNTLRGSLGALMSCYDKNQQPDDFNDLSGLELEEL